MLEGNKREQKVVDNFVEYQIRPNQSHVNYRFADTQHEIKNFCELNIETILSITAQK